MDITGNDEKEWIKRSRVRFTQLSRKHFCPDYARREIEITKRYNCNTLAFFVEMDGWLLYPSRYAEMEQTIGRTDLFAEIARECTRQGLRLIACWMGMHCQTYHLSRHPEWLCRHYSSHFGNNPFPAGSAGEQNYCLCLNTPYRAVLLGEVEEVLRRYEVDGIYFDGVYRLAGYCYCQDCQEKFRQRYARPVPTDFNDLSWQEFVNDYTAEFSRDVKALLQAVSPTIALIQDCHGTLIGTYDAQENIRGCSKYVDGFILESYHEHSGEAPTFVAMESRLVRAESRKPVLHARWLTYTPGGVHTCISESSALIWAFDALSTGGAPVLVDQEGFLYDRSLEAPLGSFMGRQGELEDVLVDAEPLKHVALLHSLECKDHRIPADVRSARAYFEGYYLALEHDHVPFDLVTEADIRGGALADYAALVLPNVEFMDDQIAANIEKFAADGGGVVATYRTSFAAADGKIRVKPALAGLLGIAEVEGVFSRGVKLATAKYDAVSLTEPTNLFEAVAEHPVTEGLLPENLYSFAGAVVEIKAEDDVLPLARLRNYDQEHAASGRSFRWVPGDWAQPFIFAGQRDGRTVYFAGDLDHAYWAFGYRYVRTLLSQAVKWVTSRRSIVEVDASPLIAVRVRRHRRKATTTIHLTNYATNQLSFPGFSGSFLANPQNLSRKHKVHDISPASNLMIRMDVGRADPVNCYSFTGQRLRSQKNGDWLEITVPRVTQGEVVIVQQEV